MYARDITVQPSDVSCLGTIKLRALLDYFQDTAGLAVEDIEGTTSELIAKGYAWVLTRYEIEFIGKLPSLDEKFTLSTFHDPHHGYNTLRVFTAPFVWAKTSWLLLDLAAGKPVKPIAHLPSITERDTAEIAPEFHDIPDFGEIDTCAEVQRSVAFHDLDYNAHVNNAAYFEWIYDTAPLDLTEHELCSVYASFRSGAKLGEKVSIKVSQRPEELCFAHKVIREGVAKPSGMFLTTWRRRDA